VVRRTCAVVAILAAACGKGRDPAEARPAGSSSAAAPAAGQGMRCELLPFAVSTPVPEASAAAWIAINGRPHLLVVGDSGNHGAYGIIDPDTGATIETGKLPLSDDASDDLEGLSAIGDRFYGLTSSGWIRVWRRQGQGFELVENAYPLGPVEHRETGGGDPDGSAGGAWGKAPRGIDLPDRKSRDRPPDGDGMVCGAHAINCGRNYEGLCLSPAAHTGGCVGFAASKADGHLYCLTEESGKLAVHRDRAIAITRPGALADCTFGDDGAVWAASNLFDISRVYRVTHWEDPATAQVELIGPLPNGFPELIAVRGEVVYRMSDMGVAPSLMARFRCRR
jgi:outer membrane protein assembly factor BamB